MTHGPSLAVRSERAGRLLAGLQKSANETGGFTTEAENEAEPKALRPLSFASLGLRGEERDGGGVVKGG